MQVRQKPRKKRRSRSQYTLHEVQNMTLKKYIRILEEKGHGPDQIRKVLNIYAAKKSLLRQDLLKVMLLLNKNKLPSISEANSSQEASINQGLELDEESARLLAGAE